MASTNNGGPSEDLMQTHEVFLSTLRSRLTKLQVNQLSVHVCSMKFSHIICCHSSEN